MPGHSPGEEGEPLARDGADEAQAQESAAQAAAALAGGDLEGQVTEEFGARMTVLLPGEVPSPPRSFPLRPPHHLTSCPVLGR